MATKVVKTAKKDSPPTMRIKVYSPYQTYFDNDGYSISGTNETGDFDILPHHHNFLTLLTAGKLYIRGLENDKTIKINRGLMHVKKDNVIVFLDV